MFTGIIEEVGKVQRVVSGSEWGQLMIEASLVLERTKIGDSIAVNGTCLTVTSMTDRSFTADVMAETMRKTNLGSLGNGDGVNLERAMAADGRFGGHIVSGHIDGSGTVAEMKQEGNAVWVTIAAPPEVMQYVVGKGSIAIDGISLTVATENPDSFQVSVIPHTGLETTLLKKKKGDTVNLETDIIGKYVQKLIQAPEGNQAKSAITMDFLQENGF